MTGAELGVGIITGITALISIVSVATAMITKINTKEIKSMRNVYLGKLANSDASIQDAMKYLELTNGLKQLNGEKN